MLDELTALTPEEVLHRSEVFGTDLFEDGLGKRILAIYEEIGSTPGSVRSILKKTVD